MDDTDGGTEHEGQQTAQTEKNDGEADGGKPMAHPPADVNLNFNSLYEEATGSIGIAQTCNPCQTRQVSSLMVQLQAAHRLLQEAHQKAFWMQRHDTQHTDTDTGARTYVRTST